MELLSDLSDRVVQNYFLVSLIFWRKFWYNEGPTLIIQFLVLFSSFSKAESFSLRVQNDFQSCGLLLNVEKSEV